MRDHLVINQSINKQVNQSINQFNQQILMDTNNTTTRTINESRDSGTIEGLLSQFTTNQQTFVCAVQLLHACESQQQSSQQKPSQQQPSQQQPSSQQSSPTITTTITTTTITTTTNNNQYLVLKRKGFITGWTVLESNVKKEVKLCS